MLSTTEEQLEESENYFVSMTDMMVGMLFIFIIMLMVFALNYRKGDDDSKRVKDCLADLLTRNAALSADINEKVNNISATSATRSRRSNSRPINGDVSCPTSASA
jgi:hypothetical protein